MLIFMKDNIKDYINNIDIKNIKMTKDYNLIKKSNYKDNISKSDKKVTIDEIIIPKKYLDKKRISKDTFDLLDSTTKDSIAFGKKIHRILELLDFKNQI